MSQQYSSSTHIYTDASKNSNGVGFATIIGHENHKFSLPPSTNIYTTETYAIFEALKIASSSNSDSFTIIGDSLSALISISNPYSKNELVQHIQKLISTSNKTFSFMWVPSHVGIYGNERADKSANEATLPHNALKINLTTSSELLDIINTKISDTWQTKWTSVPLSNKLRNIKPSIKKMEFPL
uniref:RNase H type-1 domain-containing protein n=1 Tax=Schizaphis graminum TaxID=13262 RepID=A0A2S2NNA3_SCHGA